MALQKLGALFNTKEFTSLNIDIRVMFKDLPATMANQVAVTSHQLTTNQTYSKQICVAAPRVVTALIDKPICSI